MKTLRLTLNVSNLGEQTHIWFPAPAGKFNVVPTEIQTDKKYGNKIACFDFPNVNKIQIKANFPLEIAASSRRDVGTPRNNDVLKQFLAPNRFVQSDDKTIIHLAENLTKNISSDRDKARRCFDFVINYLTYANPIRGLYSSIQALTDRGVDCGGFSTFLTALLRAVEIPARCVFGWAILSKFGYHAWVEYYDRQKEVWIPADPSVTYLSNRTKLDAGFGFIDDDRVILSVGEDIELAGKVIKWTTPLLQSPVVVSFNHIDIPVNFKESLVWTIQ